MTQAIQTQQTFRIHVIAASPAALLAILSIASTLGIESQQAADRLASLPTVLAEDVAGPDAQRVSAVLTALGLRVRLDPTFSRADPYRALSVAFRFSAAIQLVAGHDRHGLAMRLIPYLEMTERCIADELSGTEGLVLHGVDESRVEVLRQVLRRERAARLIAADPATSVFDAFAVPDARIPVVELVRLGLTRCRFSGAVGGALNHATAQHLARRTKGSLVIVNRAFQRFDLFLNAAPGLAPKELAGFLDARPGARARVAPGERRRIETDLPFHVAEQFLADYAAIGLDVCARLRGRLDIPSVEPENH